jgi:hypothetical protein
MKRIGFLILLAGIALPTMANAFCTNTVVSSGASTKVLAASTSSSAPPRLLFVTAGGACGMWCSVGDTAAEGLGFYVGPGQSFVESQLPGAQFPPNSFPQTMSGQVNCFLPTGQTCASTTANACRQ